MDVHVRHLRPGQRQNSQSQRGPEKQSASHKRRPLWQRMDSRDQAKQLRNSGRRTRKPHGRSGIQQMGKQARR